MTNEEIAALPVYTAAEQLKFWAYVVQSGNGVASYSQNGRSVTRVSLNEAIKWMEYWEDKLAIEQGTSSGIALAQFRDPI